jgi:hypothetical protein
MASITAPNKKSYSKSTVCLPRSLVIGKAENIVLRYTAPYHKDNHRESERDLKKLALTKVH